jgi:hypothetical protein
MAAIAPGPSWTQARTPGTRGVARQHWRAALRLLLERASLADRCSRLVVQFLRALRDVTHTRMRSLYLGRSPDRTMVGWCVALVSAARALPRMRSGHDDGWLNVALIKLLSLYCRRSGDRTMVERDVAFMRSASEDVAAIGRPSNPGNRTNAFQSGSRTTLSGSSPKQARRAAVSPERRGSAYPRNVTRRWQKPPLRASLDEPNPAALKCSLARVIRSKHFRVTNRYAVAAADGCPGRRARSAALALLRAQSGHDDDWLGRRTHAAVLAQSRTQSGHDDGWLASHSCGCARAVSHAVRTRRWRSQGSSVIRLCSRGLGRSPDSTMAGGGVAVIRLYSLCFGCGADRTMAGRGIAVMRLRWPCFGCGADRTMFSSGAAVIRLCSLCFGRSPDGTMFGSGAAVTRLCSLCFGRSPDRTMFGLCVAVMRLRSAYLGCSVDRTRVGRQVARIPLCRSRFGRSAVRMMAG